MKPHVYIHRNLYARGFGFSIVREGNLIFNFWLWHLSGCFYFGKRSVVEQSIWNQCLTKATVRAEEAERREKEAVSFVKEAVAEVKRMKKELENAL